MGFNDAVEVFIVVEDTKEVQWLALSSSMNFNLFLVFLFLLFMI